MVLLYQWLKKKQFLEDARYLQQEVVHTKAVFPRMPGCCNLKLMALLYPWFKKKQFLEDARYLQQEVVHKEAVSPEWRIVVTWSWYSCCTNGSGRSSSWRMPGRCCDVWFISSAQGRCFWRMLDGVVLKVVGNEKWGGSRGWLLVEAVTVLWRSMSVCFLMQRSSFLLRISVSCL